MKPEPLSEEYKYYQSVKSKLVEESEGKFAFIKGNELVGLFDNDMDAYEVGISKFGNVPFLIIRVSREDEQYWMPALGPELWDMGYL